MKKTIIMLFLFVSIIGKAQNDETYVDALVSGFTESLDYRGISTYFFAKRYCLGEIELFQLSNGKMCASKGTYFEVYIVWQEDNDNIMIKKIDNCGLFFSLPLNDERLYNSFIDNVSRLQFETVKPYEVANPENSPTLATSVHPCSRSYYFKSSENTFKKEYKLFDLTNGSKQPNLNYKSNNELMIVELDKLLDEIVTRYDSKFKRQF